MSQSFQHVGLLGRRHGETITQTLDALHEFLLTCDVEVHVETKTAELLPEAKWSVVSLDELCKIVELIIVVGGDGCLLHAARHAVLHNVPVLGINRGRLGFLTDIGSTDLLKIGYVLTGHYREEKRFLLEAEIHHQQAMIGRQMGLNDVVLLPGDIAHMIEFEVFVDNEFVSKQRADGLIVATPTGSTAYALSGGGPILHPSLDALVMVPMFPHTLSNRPIVVNGNSEIKFDISINNEAIPGISCDGQKRLITPPCSSVIIRKKQEHLRLIHPLDYNYYHTLRTKLRWG